MNLPSVSRVQLLIFFVSVFGIWVTRCQECSHERLTNCVTVSLGNVDLTSNLALLSAIPADQLDEVCREDVPRALACIEREVQLCEAYAQVAWLAAEDIFRYICSDDGKSTIIKLQTCMNDPQLEPGVAVCLETFSNKSSGADFVALCRLVTEFQVCMVDIGRQLCGSEGAEFMLTFFNVAFDGVAKLLNCNLEKRGACASDPCANGGGCVVVGAGYACNCLPGTTGANCQTRLDGKPSGVDLGCIVVPCRHNGTCFFDGSRYRCFCQPGFVGSVCGVSDISPGGSTQTPSELANEESEKSPTEASNHPGRGTPSSNRTLVIILSIILPILFIMVVVLCVLLYCKRRTRTEPQNPTSAPEGRTELRLDKLTATTGTVIEPGLEENSFLQHQPSGIYEEIRDEALANQESYLTLEKSPGYHDNKNAESETDGIYHYVGAPNAEIVPEANVRYVNFQNPTRPTATPRYLIVLDSPTYYNENNAPHTDGDVTDAPSSQADVRYENLQNETTATPNDFAAVEMTEDRDAMPTRSDVVNQDGTRDRARGENIPQTLSDEEFRTVTRL